MFMCKLDGAYQAIDWKMEQTFRSLVQECEHAMVKLEYEQADDDQYHLVTATLFHVDGCRNEDATPSSAVSRPGTRTSGPYC